MPTVGEALTLAQQAMQAGDPARATAMMNLDLVVATDTSVAHLAGALGVPVWVALQFAPSWRRLLERTDSPWYPSMRLFRQSRFAEWDEVFAEIAQQLRSLSAPAGI